MELKQKSIGFIFLAFIFIIIVVYVLVSPFTKLKSYNLANLFTTSKRISSNDVVLVVIDDKSLSKIGRWPWKRQYYLEIFDFFHTYAKTPVIAYDGLVMAPDIEHPESDKKFFSNIGKFENLVAGVAFSYDGFESAVNEAKYDELLKTKSDIKIIDKRSLKNKQQSAARSFTALQYDYFKNINSLGMVNVIEDSDGYIRKASQIINYKGEFFPSLSFMMYSKLTGIKEYTLTDKYLYGNNEKYSLKIPIENEKGFVTNYIYYYKTTDGIYSHKKYSACDIIESYRNLNAGKKPIIDPNEFDDKVVFVGANAQAQALTDVGRTPVAETFSGLDIQATNFDNLIGNNFFKMVSNGYNFMLCLFVFVLIFVLASVFPLLITLLFTIIIMFAILFLSFFMYLNKIAIGLILPEIFVFIALACAYSYKYLVEGNKKLKIQNAMGKYLSYDVMQNVVKNIDNISLGGKRANITVLFADIRNFTSISESMEADSVSEILNEYFSAMVPIVEEFDGVLNKFMGDAVLAIFGEPKKSENHAYDAVRCADKMLKRLKILQEKWLDEGKPRIEIGIGISTGDAYIGNIGSKDRLEYTVIGDTVNTASRIENFNKVYKTNFLISETTFELVQNYVDVITIRNVAIRGKANKINIYEVVRLI